MSLIGYVTLEEANEYIEIHYLSKDNLRVNWNALSDDDRRVLLNRSFQTIELLPFAGKKASPEQTSVFPRWHMREVPATVKWAQIENALALSDASAVEDATYYERLRAHGITSYTIGNLSESFGSTSYDSKTTGILSETARRLLQPLLGGGYRM